MDSRDAVNDCTAGGRAEFRVGTEIAKVEPWSETDVVLVLGVSSCALGASVSSTAAGWLLWGTVLGGGMEEAADDAAGPWLALEEDWASGVAEDWRASPPMRARVFVTGLKTVLPFAVAKR